jgi:hypothetical protein
MVVFLSWLQEPQFGTLLDPALPLSRNDSVTQLHHRDFLGKLQTNMLPAVEFDTHQPEAQARKNSFLACASGW